MSEKIWPIQAKKLKLHKCVAKMASCKSLFFSFFFFLNVSLCLNSVPCLNRHGKI